MITAVSFLVLVFIIIGFYVYNYKESEIEISFIRGFMIGVSLTSPELEGVKTNYLDIYFGFFIFAIIWDE